MIRFDGWHRKSAHLPRASLIFHRQGRRVVDSLLVALAERRHSRQSGESVEAVLQRVADGVASSDSVPAGRSPVSAAQETADPHSLFAISLSPNSLYQTPAFPLSQLSVNGLSPPSFVSDLESRANDALWSGFKEYVASLLLFYF